MHYEFESDMHACKAGDRQGPPPCSVRLVARGQQSGPLNLFGVAKMGSVSTYGCNCSEL